MSFTPDGSLIYAGFTKQIYTFDVNQPGRQIENFKTYKKRSTGQTGIISCFDFLPSHQIFAAGSYSKSSKILLVLQWKSPDEYIDSYDVCVWKFRCVWNEKTIVDQKAVLENNIVLPPEVMGSLYYSWCVWSKE